MKMRSSHVRTWKIAILLENKQTKIKSSQDRTWNMVRNTEKVGK
jgi:hypothetical protein